MKKWIAMMLSLALALSLCACGNAQDGDAPSAADTTAAQTAGGLMVGYAKMNITPDESVPMAGQGNSSERMSSGYLDYLFATCVAISDGGDNTVLIYSMDIQNAYTPVNGFRDAVSLDTGIPTERIMMCFTHTHSGPDIANTAEPSIARYNEKVTEAAIEGAKKAMEDMLPAQMHIASTQTESLNFVRRYEMNDGTYCGDNFGSTASGYKGHETEADHELQLVKFTREGGDDVIMANFQMHSNYTISGNQLSADVAGAFRNALEQKTGSNIIYLNGASGNINPKSRITDENKAADHKEWGEMLAQYAVDVTYTQVDTGALKGTHVRHDAQTNHSQDHLLSEAMKIKEVFETTNDRNKCVEMGKPFGIESAYHAIAIVQQAGREKTMDMNMYVFSVGDVAFLFAPVEMFDTNGMYIKENSPFDMTFICGYANYCQGYMPSQMAYEHGGYEVQTTAWAPGTAEEVADLYLEMLSGLHTAQ